MCGIGAIASREPGAPVGFEGILGLMRAMEERGTEHGAGFATYRGDGVPRSRLFSRSPRLPLEAPQRVDARLGHGFYSISVEGELPLGPLEGDTWVYQSSRFLDVYKSIGWPGEVAKLYRLGGGGGSPVWIGHTRYPTNSPGFRPWLAHPFASGDVAVVHNGDLSSFGINARAVQNLMGLRRLTGNDSEVVAHLLNHLLTREGLGPWEAMGEMIGGRGWRRLDGPFAVIALWGTREGPYLMAFVDKHHFRPLYASVTGERVLLASEAGAIRALDPSAPVAMMRGGSRLLVYPDGEVEAEGLSRDSTPIEPPGSVVEEGIDARGLNDLQLNRRLWEEVEKKGLARAYGLVGQRYVANGFRGGRLELWGVVGNASFNLTEGLEATVYGDVQEDVGDSMRDTTLAIHGNAGDALGQAMRSGFIAVKGDAGNRLGVQMKGGCIVVGGDVGDFAAEYMAGGCMVLLGKVGRHIASGMVGGVIYALEKLDPLEVGSPQPRGMIETYLRHRGNTPPEALEERLRLVGGSLELGRPRLEYRYLTPEERDELRGILRKYISLLGLGKGLEEVVETHRFSVIKVDRH